jgi:hypothetical protein
MGRRDLSTSPELSSTLVRVVDPPVVQRIKQVMNYVTSMAGKNEMPPIVNRLAMEMISEIRDYPPEIVELYVKQVAALIYWTGSGEIIKDFPMPPDFVVQQDVSVDRYKEIAVKPEME